MSRPSEPPTGFVERLLAGVPEPAVALWRELTDAAEAGEVEAFVADMSQEMARFEDDLSALANGVVGCVAVITEMVRRHPDPALACATVCGMIAACVLERPLGGGHET